MADKTAKYKIANDSELHISEDSVFKIEPDTTPSFDGIGYMEIGKTFRVSGDVVSQDIIVGTNDGYVYRLTPDGSEVWQVFNLNAITAVIVDTNNNIVAGNNNIIEEGSTCINVSRPSDGVVITFVDLGLVVNCLALQSDGKILVGHSTGILRLNTDYSVDETFIFTYYDGFNITSIIVNNDNSFYIGVTQSANTVALINPDGSLNFKFITISEDVNCLAIQSDGKILAGTPTGVYRFNADGSVDDSWTTLEYVANFILIVNNEVWITDYSQIIIFDGDGDYLVIISNGEFNSRILALQNDNKILDGCNNGIRSWLYNYYEDISFSSTISSQVNAITLIN